LVTERGRELWARIDPALDDLASEIHQLRGTALKAGAVANDGWRLLNEALSDKSAGPRHVSQPRQTSPF
jgi:hypothetical protein